MHSKIKTISPIYKSLSNIIRSYRSSKEELKDSIVTDIRKRTPHRICSFEFEKNIPEDMRNVKREGIPNRLYSPHTDPKYHPYTGYCVSFDDYLAGAFSFICIHQPRNCSKDLINHPKFNPYIFNMIRNN